MKKITLVSILLAAMSVSATEIVNELDSTKTITFHSSEGTNFSVGCGSPRHNYKPYVIVESTVDRPSQRYNIKKSNCREVSDHLGSFEQEPDASLDFTYDKHTLVLKRIRIY